MEPFANKYRPESIDDLIGQQHLVGEGKIVSRLLENGYLPNMIFYGPPGVGKTTLAKIIARTIKFKYVELNATECGVKDIKELITEDMKQTILFIDEFHMLNKRQQQVLLDSTETGNIILIASTTENPFFAIYKAIISRSSLFEFKPITNNDIVNGLKRLMEKVKKDYPKKKITIDESIYEKIADISNGDYRSAINKLELLFYKNLSAFSSEVNIVAEDMELLAISNSYTYDRDGDEHYNALSAFHKSLRGSDIDGSLHYLARLLKGGDLISITRRLLCVASEDVGLANPEAVQVVKSCVDSALQLGLPEAKLPLAEATIFLALQPKSNSVCIAIDKAIEEIENGNTPDIPAHLKDAHYSGAKKLGHGTEYQYPHNFPNHFVKQQYLPDGVEGNYYEAGENKIEKLYENYWKGIK